MPWQEVSVKDQRREFISLALQDGVNRRDLCRRFAISPQTGYKWLSRWAGGDECLEDRSRRPHESPTRTPAAVEARVLEVRDAHPAWGARKIARRLVALGHQVPSVSTVHAILVRHGRVTASCGGTGQPWQRFEKEAPNLLWQMDFKGYFSLDDGVICHPLSVIDDHSRYALCLGACADERRPTVQTRLEATFRRYGLPLALFVDNGSPWGNPEGQPWTRLGVWLLKLGVAVSHSRPYHPQSRGKVERFHRTLTAEVLQLQRLRDLDHAQRAFDRWRTVYNLERPHEALGQQVPASRYRPSPRPMPDPIPKVVYDTGEIVRRVGTSKAYVSFKGSLWKVPQAFSGEQVAIRPRGPDGHYDICFAAHPIATINLTTNTSVSHLPEQVSTISPG